MNLRNIKMYFLVCFFIGIVLGHPMPNNDPIGSYEYTGQTAVQEKAHTKGSRSWPWVCSIGAFVPDTKNEWGHVCTGTIVTRRHVITTIGCFIYFFDLTGHNNISVRAGNNDLLDNTGVQIQTISSYVKHPSYDKALYNGYFDIVVLSMQEDFDFSSNIRPISLPDINENGIALKENNLNEHLVFSYWGVGGVGKESIKMKTKTIQLVPSNICQKSYNNIDFNYLQCGNDDSGKICDFDFGSPTFAFDDDTRRYVLQGLLMDVDLYSCNNDNKPNLIVSITTTCNIQFIYEQLHNKTFPKLLPDGTKICDENFYSFENDDLIYENCGRNNILDGRPPKEGSLIAKYPWIVSLGYNGSTKWVHICGGSIVTRNKIITAGHCIKKFRKLERMIEVRAGDDKVQNIKDDEGLQLKMASNYTTHPKYNLTAQNRYFDVGIVTLASPLDITEFVRPICLRNLKEAKAISKDDETGRTLTTTGWGHKDLDPNAEDYLKEIKAQILSEKICNEMYEKKNGYKTSVPNFFSSDLMCARDPTSDKGTCNGDSGGPAVYRNQQLQRYFLYGIVGGNAKGECDTLEYPNIYVRTGDVEVLHWIIEQVQKAPKNIKIEDITEIENQQTRKYTCLVDSYPVSRIHWSVQDSSGKQIQTKNIYNNNSIEFNTNSDSKSFAIQCQAKNRLGSFPEEIEATIIKLVFTTGSVIGGVIGSILIFLIPLLIFYIYKKKPDLWAKMMHCMYCRNGKYTPVNTSTFSGCTFNKDANVSTLNPENSYTEDENRSPNPEPSINTPNQNGVNGHVEQGLPSLIREYREEKYDETKEKLNYIDRKYIKDDLSENIKDKKYDGDGYDNNDEVNSLEAIITHEMPTLIQGEAGSGKSYLQTKTTKDWASKNILQTIELLIDMSARVSNSFGPLPLLEIVKKYTSLIIVADKWKHVTYEDLQSFADSHKLSFFIDALDEFGTIHVDFQNLKQRLGLAIKDPTMEITFQDFVIGLLTGLIFRGAIIIGTGRLSTIKMLYSTLLTEKANVYTLKSFDKKDMQIMFNFVHCDKEHEKVIETMKDDNWEKLAETPSVCKLMVTYLSKKLKEGSLESAKEWSFAAIRLHSLLNSLQGDYAQNSVGFTGMSEKYRNELHEICLLCFKTLQDNVYDIHGSIQGEFFRSKYGQISFGIMKKSDIFKISDEKYSNITISTKHLSDQEFLASAIACQQNTEDLTLAIEKMHIERSIPVLTHMVNLMTGEDMGVQSNFLSYLDIFSTSEKEKIQAMIYDQVINLSMMEDLRIYNDDNKNLPFTAVTQEKKAIRAPQIVLLAKLISVCRVSLKLTTTKKGKEWELSFKSPGNQGLDSDEVEKILMFFQEAIPNAVSIKGDCGRGTTGILWIFGKKYPTVKLNFSKGCYFRLTNQDDVNGWTEFFNKGDIVPKNIGVIHLNAKCDHETTKKLIPLMVQVKHIRVYSEQDDNFWMQLQENIVKITKEKRLEWLRLAGFETTNTNISSIVQAIKHASQVMLLRLDMKTHHLLTLSEALNNHEQSKINRLKIKEIKVSLDEVDAMIRCIGSVKGKVELEDMALTPDVWDQMGNGLQTMVKDGAHQLKTLIFMKNTINLDNVEAITRCMGVIERAVLSKEHLAKPIRDKIGKGLITMRENKELKLKNLVIKSATTTTTPKDFVDMMKKAEVEIQYKSSITLTIEVWNKMGDELLTIVKDRDHHLRNLTIMRNTINLDNVELITRFMGAIEKTILNTEDLTAEIRHKIGDGLILMKESGDLKLKTLFIKDVTLPIIPKDFVDVMKVVGVAIGCRTSMKLTTDVWNKLGDDLQVMVKEGDHQLKNLLIMRETINLDNAEAITRFMGGIEKVVLNEDNLTETIRYKIGSGLIQMKENGDLKLKNLEIKDAAAPIFPKDFVDMMKKAGVAIHYKPSMTLTADIWNKMGDELETIVAKGDHQLKNLTIMKNTINLDNVESITRFMGGIERAILNKEDLTEPIRFKIGDGLIGMNEKKNLKLRKIEIKDATAATMPKDFVDMMDKAGVEIHYKTKEQKNKG